MNSIEVSIIYVVYKGVEDLKASILSVRKYYTKSNYEIIVVNNDTENNLTKSIHQYDKKVLVINNKVNSGYGGGNNLGAKKAKGKYILILNPDTQIKKGTIENLKLFLEKHKNAAIVAPNLIDENGKVFTQLGSRELTPLRAIFSLSIINRIFPNNPISKNYYFYDLKQNRLREADAVPGSAFMVRTDVFEKAGYFDEKMFLYFEESDLGKRVKSLGYKIYINPKSEVIHKWHVNKENQVLQKHFNKSRFYYFKKHFGYLNAVIVEAVCRISFYDILFLLILLLGAFLRFYQTERTLSFNSELAHVYIEIRNYIISNQIPLIGPATSHPWLKFGPLYYWVMIPIVKLSEFNPLYISYIMKLVSLFVLIFNYFFIGRLINKKTAVLSTFLISVSPTLINLSNTSMLFSFVPVLFYPFIYVISNFKGRYRDVFLLFLLYSVILNFHLSALIYTPFILLYLFINKDNLNFKKWGISLFAFLIPFASVIIYDYKQNFEMSKNLLLWIPYRLFGFAGIVSQNNIDEKVFINNIYSFYIFITKLFIIGNSLLGALVFVSFAYIFTKLFIDIFFPVFLSLKFKFSNHNSHKSQIASLLQFQKAIRIKISKLISINTVSILILMLILGYLGIFVHGNPPDHYYLPLYTIPFIIVSFFITNLRTKYQKMFILFFLILFLNNSSKLFSKNWFYLTDYNSSIYNIPYRVQKNISDYILEDAKGRNMSIKRVGFNDRFANQFADNYYFLLWLRGNAPVQVGSVIMKEDKIPEYEYTIYEIYDEKSFNQSDDIKNINGVYIKKLIL